MQTSKEFLLILTSPGSPSADTAPVESDAKYPVSLLCVGSNKCKVVCNSLKNFVKYKLYVFNFSERLKIIAQLLIYP